MVGIFDDRILTVRDVADLLHVHPNTVRMWNNQGLLKAFRLGSRGDRRFMSTEIQKFLTSSGDGFDLEAGIQASKGSDYGNGSSPR